MTYSIPRIDSCSLSKEISSVCLLSSEHLELFIDGIDSDFVKHRIVRIIISEDEISIFSIEFRVVENEIGEGDVNL